jgi:diadenosine tetraphosphate (Ap4A) HIT family hydrolase
MFAICGFCINRPISETVETNILSTDEVPLPIEIDNRKVQGMTHYDGTLTRRFYTPPQGITYENNPSVFGRILDGSLPCRPLMETEHLLAFYDKYPKANFHALVIPKRYIKTVKHLRPDRDLNLIQEMTEMALDIIQKKMPDIAINKDYILVYHVPPFNSVSHLHLHILAPSSEMNPVFRNIKYQPGTLWCIDADAVLGALRNGKRV